MTTSKELYKRIPNKLHINTLKNLKDFDQNLSLQKDFVNILRLYSLVYQFADSNSIFVSDGGGNTFFSSLQNINLKKVKDQLHLEVQDVWAQESLKL